MGKMRKAVVFSIASLLLVTLFLVSSEMLSKYEKKETEIEVTRARVRILGAMMNDLDTFYFEKLIYVSAKHSLIGLSRYYYDNPAQIQRNLGYALNEVMNDGVLYNSPAVNLTKTTPRYVDYEYTARGLTEDLSKKLSSVGFVIEDLAFNITSVGGVRQKDAWNLELNVSIVYHISDANKIASWQGYSTKKITIPLEGIYLRNDFSGGGMIDRSSWCIEDIAIYQERPALSKLSGMPYNPSANDGLRNYGCSP